MAEVMIDMTGLGIVRADVPLLDRVLTALRTLRHGPWWPPLDELIDSARHFFAGSLGAGGQPGPGGGQPTPGGQPSPGGGPPRPDTAARLASQ